MRTKQLSSKFGEDFDISQYPNFSKSGSIIGMKERYYGTNCLLVRCGNYIYNVTSEPYIYYCLAK